MVTLTKTTRMSRRRLIGFIGVGLAAGFMSPVSLRVFAIEQNIDASDLETFMLVSRALTGKRYLNPQIGSRLFLLLKTPELLTNMKKLQPLPTSTPNQWEATLQQTVRQILAGWYLGVAEQQGQPRLVSYEQALMFDAVSDILGIRSYCSNKPGYWQERPDGKL